MVGNKAIAWGAKLSRVQVAAAFPVTPQTTITEYLSEFVFKGELDCEWVNAEGELSTQVIAQAASRVGARAFVCTSGPGQLYMHHPMHDTSRERLPVVMAVVHRGNKSMQPDHTDLMSQLFTGWIQWYCENNQEVLDTCILAYKVAEDMRVRLPVAYGSDGFILSYTAEPVDIPEQELVDEFLPPYKPNPSYMPEDFDISTVRRPRGGSDPQLAWKTHHEAFLGAKEVIIDANEEFAKKFGRSYGNGLIEEYRTEDAEAVIIGMGTIASTSRAAIDELRKEGKPIGLVKLKCLIPFPVEDFQRIGREVQAIGMIDRNICLGLGGVGFNQLRSTLYDMEERPEVLEFHAGLAGKEVRVNDIKKVAEKTLKVAKGGKVDSHVEWV